MDKRVRDCAIIFSQVKNGKSILYFYYMDLRMYNHYLDLFDCFCTRKILPPFSLKDEIDKVFFDPHNIDAIYRIIISEDINQRFDDGVHAIDFSRTKYAFYLPIPKYKEELEFERCRNT